MGNLVSIVSPLGDVAPIERSQTRRLESLATKTIVLLDNTKANSDILLDELQALLTREGAHVVRRIKATAGRPASQEIVAEVTRADGFVTGVGD